MLSPVEIFRKSCLVIARTAVPCGAPSPSPTLQEPDIGRLTMTRCSIQLAAVALLAVAMTSIAAFAADPTGLWLSQDGDVKMKVAPCGEAICGTIAWLKNPNDESGKPKIDKNNADASKRGRPIMGSAIVLPMKADLQRQFHAGRREQGRSQRLRRDHLQDQDLDADELIVPLGAVIAMALRRRPGSPSTHRFKARAVRTTRRAPWGR